MWTSRDVLQRMVVGMLLLFFIGAAHADVFRDLSFVDTKSGGFAVLSQADARLIVAESGIPVVFCTEESGMACFSSELLSFAVPVDAGDRESWLSNGRVYCVVRRFRDAHDHERPDGAWLIYSKPGEHCESEQSFDQVAIYSRVAGLRMIRSSFSTGGFLELWAVDAVGFGVTADRK